MSIFVNERKKKESGDQKSSNSLIGQKNSNQKCVMKNLPGKTSILNSSILENQNLFDYSTNNTSDTFQSLNIISTSKNSLNYNHRPFSSASDIYNNTCTSVAHDLPMSVSSNVKTTVAGTVFSLSELELKETIGEGFFGRVTKVESESYSLGCKEKHGRRHGDERVKNG
ncbi:hypothetical protein MXB_5271 [Myxobolus squamalis]|nr:hypothetical protein MXB_5271 [Myxobolus squamalis]